MSAVHLPVVRYRLGAEELLELGRAPRSASGPREPFLAGRPRRAHHNAMGELADRTGDFILKELDRALAFLCGMTGLSGGLLSAGVDAAARAGGGLLDHMPIAADVMAQGLLLGSAAVKLGLSPERARETGRALTGLGMALSSRRGEAERKALVEEAKADIVARASGELKADVMRALDAATADPPAVGGVGPVIPRQEAAAPA